MSNVANLPTAVPADNTPKTYSGTKLRAFILTGGTTLVTAAVLTAASNISSAATTASLTAASATFVPAGSVLVFGTTPLVTTADITVATTATSVAIQAAPAAVASGATANFSNLLEIPLAEELSPTLSSMEESINVHGRITPIRTTNGIDFTANIRTLAAIDDPVVRRLTAKGMSISPNNRERIVYLYDDGFALLATVNIGAPNRQAGPNQTQRAQFAANLSGTLAWSDTNATTPTWTTVNL
ncbi:hypothetical protein K7W42_17935 [Deinococcus sp. HMF7604]|uniref:hypothetical protein n=1 Tax=Deinococcus betulae TaxID=2873312 RepID=UPI001CCC9897|nr:hypothetical protein [Deinococcus betulae]MBZ9752725.1 hypothetical protein [Deinococcus betulae]